MIRKLRSIVRVRGGSALTLTLLTVMLLSPYLLFHFCS